MPQNGGEAGESSRAELGIWEVREKLGRCRDWTRWWSMAGQKDSKSAFDRRGIKSGHAHSGDRKAFLSVARKIVRLS
jgi:hypothetical protein